MNRRNFFKAAGAVVLGGLVGARPHPRPDIDGLVRAREAEWERQALEAFNQYWEALIAEHKRITTPPSLLPLHRWSNARMDNVGLTTPFPTVNIEQRATMTPDEIGVVVRQEFLRTLEGMAS